MTGPTGPQPKNNEAFQTSSGAPQPELRYLAIGRIVKAHGVQGELSVAVLTDYPERFSTLEWVFIGDEFQAEPYRLAGHRWHKQNVLLTLEGITDRMQANQLNGQLVQIPIEDAAPLPEGSFYLYQLIGLQVFTTAGEHLGELVDIIETGANDVYIVHDAAHEREILLPAISDVIERIELEQGRMTVELIEGLI